MIYKYYPFTDRSLENLKENKIWVSHHSKFNDPFDSAFSISGPLQKEYSKYITNKAICCFSKRMDSILMWSHYANNHTGFCVGFDEDRLPENPLIFDVIYTDVFPDFNTSKIKTQTKIPGKVRLKETIPPLITKYCDWSYEDEVRLILELDPDKHPEETWDGKFLKIPPDAATKIYLGCMMSHGDRNILKELSLTKKWSVMK